MNANGKALLTYRREDGRIRNVLVWGAINARPPSQDAPQVAFRLRLLGRLAQPRPLRSADGSWTAARPYDGPPLAVPRHGVQGARRHATGRCRRGSASCRCAGSRRGCRSRTSSSSTSRTGRGPLAQLEVSQNWTYGGHWQGLFGRLTYARPAGVRLHDAVGDEARRRATRATSTSTRTTRSTAPAGATTQAKCCTWATAPSVTASSRRCRPPGYPEPRSHAAPRSAMLTA